MADDPPTIEPMLGDEERFSAYVSEQRRLVREGVAAEVLRFAPYWKEAAAECGLATVTTAADLIKLPPRPLSALGAPDALLLRPSPSELGKSASGPVRRRLRRARMGRRRAGAQQRILDPLYKAVQWTIEGDVPVGWTDDDLVRLAELGRRSLDLAGVGPNDAIVGLVPPGPTLSSWQLSLGAREAGVALAGLAPLASIEAISLLGPTVLAGRPADLTRVLNGLSDSERNAVSTVLAITRVPLQPGDRAALVSATLGQAAVVESWAPLGVRALWTQCRNGQGVHTWPQTELLEVCGPDGFPTLAGEPGELVWSGLGWRGTAMLRLATGVHGQIVEGPCENCGRTTPRILDARLLAGAQPEADGEGGGARLGPISATPGTSASRLRRPLRAAAVPAAAPVPKAATAEEPVAVIAQAMPKPDEPGVVRAVAKEIAAPPPAPSPFAAVSPAKFVDLNHLPPVPDVGPDVTGKSDDEAWLPDTGEVDAWPAPVLDSTLGLAAWQVEHRRRRGRDELIVHLALTDGADLGEVLVALERTIGATQYVVSGGSRLEARLAAAGGRRVVEHHSRRRGGAGSSRTGSAASSPERR